MEWSGFDLMGFDGVGKVDVRCALCCFVFVEGR